MAVIRRQTYPDPPGDFSGEAVKLWGQIHNHWLLDDARCAILKQALYSLDRADSARKTLNEVGLVVTDRYGQIRPHPAVRTEEVSRAAFVSAMRALGLDLAPPSHPRNRS
jgi:hypothetical protein